MKRLIFITLILSAIMSVYTLADIDYKCVEDNIKINYIDQGDKSYKVIYCNGRLFLPFWEACGDFGIAVIPKDNNYILFKDDKNIVISASTGKSNKTDMFFYNNTAYVYIYKLIEPFDTMPVADIENNRLYIYKTAESNIAKHKTVSKSRKSAYIRLEDIMADGLDKSVNPNYTPEMLEKLRYTAQYLYECGQSYYVAWIPVYANPRANYWNDISQCYNLYNSYFVYTLDYMAEHNGHIGLHGYTHQYGNVISGVGYEWGANTPYSKTEQENRIKKAIYCGSRLGLNIEFFEFPHYGATNEQLTMAGKYFKLIYQSYPSQALANSFAYTGVTGKRVYYMPTPADYVHTKYDVTNTIARLKKCIGSNYAVSLFYHPVIDKSAIRESTKDGIRTWNYSNGALPSILNYVSDSGYIFSPIPIT